MDNVSNINELKERFVEITKNTNETLQKYFERLQDEADKGVIIIGTMLNSSGSSGHVMMITPGGLKEITSNEPQLFQMFNN